MAKYLSTSVNGKIQPSTPNLYIALTCSGLWISTFFYAKLGISTIALFVPSVEVTTDIVVRFSIFRLQFLLEKFDFTCDVGRWQQS